jgi:hypothetical protein
MPKHQLSLTLIHHEVNDSIIEQRADDGYINATALCSVANKRWHNYVREETTGHFLRALAIKTKINISELIQDVDIEGGTVSTWIHPKVAIHLGQWLSADFAVQVSEWVYDWMNGGANKAPSPLPAHINRYIENDHKIPSGYFSILQETTLGLVAPLHNLGFVIPSGWVPDISVGLCFCKWLRENKKLDTNSLPTYMHSYQDHRGTMPVKLYPDEYLAECRTWFRQVWLPENGARYFRKKDPSCMQYFDKIPSLAAPKIVASLPSY